MKLFGEKVNDERVEKGYIVYKGKNIFNKHGVNSIFFYDWQEKKTYQEYHFSRMYEISFGQISN